MLVVWVLILSGIWVGCMICWIILRWIFGFDSFIKIMLFLVFGIIILRIICWFCFMMKWYIVRVVFWVRCLEIIGRNLLMFGFCLFICLFILVRRLCLWGWSFFSGVNGMFGVI